MITCAQPYNSADEVTDLHSIAALFSVWLMWISISALFLISPMVLHNWGLSYEDVGGSPFEKIHPGSLVAVIALFFQLSAYGFSTYVKSVLFKNTGLAVFIVTTLMLLFYAIFVQKIPFTPILDTFGMPIIVFVVLSNTSGKNLTRYAIFLHIFFVANALLAIYEYTTGERLTPYVAGTLVVENDWRATSFMGHPLNNALLTGAYILLLCSKNGTGLKPFFRTAIILLQFASMVAFGARASLVVTILLVLLIVLKNSASILLGKLRTSISFWSVLALCLPIFALVLFGLNEISFFDRLVERFSEDKGSASARIAMFELFNYIPLRDILFGPDPDLIETLKGIEGVEAGIESIWVAFILTYGLAMSAVFFVGLFAFCFNLSRRTKPFTSYVLLFFFVVASTSVSLSAKTPTFGMLVVMLFTFQNKDTFYA